MTWQDIVFLAFINCLIFFAWYAGKAEGHEDGKK